MSSIRSATSQRKLFRQCSAFELAHIGINCDSETEAEKTADAFDGLFGFTKKVGNSSVFAGTAVEAMKSKGLGSKGHIAVATNSVVRAKNYLEMMGYKFNEESAKFKGDKMTAILSRRR